MKELNENELDKVVGGAIGDQVIASGSFASDSGTQLNILVSWAVTSNTLGQRSLEVVVSATSYSLDSAALLNGVELTVNGITYKETPQPIKYAGNALMTSPLASFSIPNVFSPAEITAVWHFNGTYSGHMVGDIRATGLAAV